MNMLTEIRAFEQYNGNPHSIKIFKRNIENAAPYEIRLDDNFVATAESKAAAYEEADDVILFFNFRALNMNFA